MRIVRGALALALVTGSCAGPQRLRAEGDAHLAHARECETRGDYDCVAEQRQAAKQHYKKAERRADTSPRMDFF